MRPAVRTTILAAVVATGGLVFAARSSSPPVGAPATPAAVALPRLVDLGAGKCIPCKAMAPILEELKVEYAGRLEVQFIDVWLDPEAARPYGISMIPTQIFYGADGRELARHQGFIAKADILGKWKSLGVAFWGEAVGELLTAFGRAFEASAALALPAAFLWGVLSVALSPCHLSSIPLVVAYMSGGAELPSGRRAAGLSASFALGILASIAAIGAATAAAGRMAGDVGRVGTWVLAAVFFGVGLNLLGVLPLPTWSSGPAPARRRGPLGALLLGLVFGAALGPCTFAFMAPLLGLVFHASKDAVGYGVLLVTLYGLGHAAAIVAAGASAQNVQRWLSWKAGARAAAFARGGAGLAVIAGGLYFLYTSS